MQPGTPILVVYKDDDMFSGSFPATILKKGKNNCYSVQWSEGEHKGTVTHNVHISNINATAEAPAKTTAEVPAEAPAKTPVVDLTFVDSDSDNDNAKTTEPPRKRLKSHDTLDDYKVFTSGEENLEEDSVSEASIKSFDMAITNDDTSKESNMSCPNDPIMELMSSDRWCIESLQRDHDKLKKDFVEYAKDMEEFRKTLIDSIRELKNNY